MKQVTKIFLIISLVYSIITVVYLAICAILCFSGAFSSIADVIIKTIENEGGTVPEEVESIISFAFTFSGVSLLISIVIPVLGIIFSKKALRVFATDDMSVALGVLLIIFGFLPSGILYLVYRNQYFNAKVNVIDEV